ncbi:MAG TPA: hypothetical protein VJN21_01355 [Candidatus Acidoferrales bacterium]|nr:hypothetical protein [Candidatus Acidoferrales bacterium]
MRRTVIVLGLSVIFAASGAWAQDQPSGASAPATSAPPTTMLPATTHGDLYCSGIVTSQHVPTSTQIITGEQSNVKLTFSEGDYVYLNRGTSKGVKPGDEFSIIRNVDDISGIPWYTGQDDQLHGMGQTWTDIGRIKVLIAAKNVSTAQVVDSCDFMLRGDVAVPYEDRPVPAVKSEKDFDRFAPPSGKPKARVVYGKGFSTESGDHDIIYVNQGSSKGVKVGDYFRIFRYIGHRDDTVFQTPDVALDVYGYGSAPGGYNWSNLPRQIIGEGIVLRTSPKSSTVLITYSLREIFDGDYCELE